MGRRMGVAAVVAVVAAGLLVAAAVLLGNVLRGPSEVVSGPSVPVPPSASMSGAPPTPGGFLAPAPAPAPSPRHRPACSAPARVAFSPTSISVPGVVGRSVVLARGYDAGVPGTPPLTSAGKLEFAWVPDIAPGMPAGNVLLNAHTWPDGTALGNRLLDGLVVGSRIVVRGSGHELCYAVTSRVEVSADASVPAYFALDGPPQLAIVVCSGERLGPGRWTMRTIWYAAPAHM